MAEMKWEIQNVLSKKPSPFSVDSLIDLLLTSRGITAKKDRELFLHPDLTAVTADSVGIDKNQLDKALRRIKSAIANNELIIVFGDYDVDGITGSAVLWETLHGLKANTFPYIPHRIEEGYGLSVKGIENLLIERPRTKLIITVDNGIVANEAVEFANSKGIDVIITDHHMPHEDKEHMLPSAYAIVHTTKLCGAGVAYVLSQHLSDKRNEGHLELAALGTVADMVPLTDSNRAIVYHGLKKLKNTTRPGLLALFDDAGIDPTAGISPYQVGHMIAPRLNAAGRLESAMDALRLLCTQSKERAVTLARQLGRINKERQHLMTSAALHAIERIRTSKEELKKVLVIAHESYQEGVIGLIAGRIVEEFYRPAIVISKREKHSKASVRSVHGFNIIEFLRAHGEHFVNVGGHPMAAGFTIESTKIRTFTKLLEESGEKLITDDMLQRFLRIDCELDLSHVSEDVYMSIQQLQPFGIGNPEPVFLSKKVKVDEKRVIGKEGKHLKMKVSKENKSFDVIAFGMGERSEEINAGDTIDIVYTIDENVWNGRKTLQLKLRDFKKT